MAKRFTDTTKWKDTWFQDLPTKYKLFWVYLLDDCDAAGLWKPNIRLACFQVGEPFEISELLRVFGDRIMVTQDGYWHIKKFIEFQYGELSEACHPHKAIVKLLKSHKIEGYSKGTNTLQEQDKEQEKDKDKEKDKESIEIFEIEKCLEIAIFDQRWTKANKTTMEELSLFNNYLEKLGKYKMNPLDYKTYFAKLKGKYPGMLKKEYSVEELREMSKNITL